MTDLDRAIAAAREALNNEAPTAEIDAVRLDGAIRELIAAIDAAQQAPPAALAVPASARGYADDDRKRIVSAMQAMRDRLGGFLVKTCGDSFDGDIDTMLEAINFMKALRIEAPPAAAVPAANVTPMRQPRADLSRLVESINAAVYSNGDGLSVTEAIGALELAKLELLKEQEQ